MKTFSRKRQTGETYQHYSDTSSTKRSKQTATCYECNIVFLDSNGLSKHRAALHGPTKAGPPTLIPKTGPPTLIPKKSANPQTVQQPIKASNIVMSVKIQKKIVPKKSEIFLFLDFVKSIRTNICFFFEQNLYFLISF